MPRALQDIRLVARRNDKGTRRRRPAENPANQTLNDLIERCDQPRRNDVGAFRSCGRGDAQAQERHQAQGHKAEAKVIRPPSPRHQATATVLIRCTAPCAQATSED